MGLPRKSQWWICDFFHYTLRDEEFPKKLFGDLNCELLGSPGDDNIIVLSDSDEEEEVVRRTPKLLNLLLRTPRLQPSPLLTSMMPLRGCQMIVMTVASPIGHKVIAVMVGMRLVRLRLLCQ
jgi:hypothetical protein